MRPVSDPDLCHHGLHRGLALRKTFDLQRALHLLPKLAEITQTGELGQTLRKLLDQVGTPGLEGRELLGELLDRLCREAAIAPSMGSVDDAYDNAMAESFFATIEQELLTHATFRSRDDARRAIFDYIEGFYNRRRRHSSIGFLSPEEFDRTFRSATHAAGGADSAGVRCQGGWENRSPSI